MWQKKYSVISVKLRLHGPSFPYLVVYKQLQKYTAEVLENLAVTTLQNFKVLTSQVVMIFTDTSSSMVHTGHLLRNVLICYSLCGYFMRYIL